MTIPCKLIIKDEVNCRLEGLPVEIRRKLANTFKYVDPTAKYRPAVKLGRWDGSINFFSIGGDGYIAHLPLILQILEDTNVEVVEFIDNRNPIDITFSEISNDFWGDTCWPAGHPHANKPIRIRDDQVNAINIALKNPQSIQCLSTSFGKCQPLDSKVLTPSGFVTMENIKKGDKVITPDGSIVKVLETYYPGHKDVYELTFIDGRTARACGDHLWKIHNHEWRRTKAGIWRTISTQEIQALLPKVKRGLKIPLISLKNDVPDVDLPIDPWLLGVMIGDGSFRHGRITISSNDEEIINRVQSILHEDYYLKHIGNVDYSIMFKDKKTQFDTQKKYLSSNDVKENGFIYHVYNKIILNLGLNHKLSHEKFIPEIYFNGSYNQRIELLRGLMDSDGTTQNGGISFSTCSEKLANGVVALVRSIGGIPKIYYKKPTYTYNGEKKDGKPAYDVYIRFPEPWELFSLTRKKQKTGFKYHYTGRLHLKITDVKKVSNEPVKCILIDHPDHLYITDNYVVTHNTILTASLSKICEKYGRTIIIVPNKSLVEQTEADYTNCSLDVGVYYGDRKQLDKTHTICTWQSLSVLDKKSKNYSHTDELTFNKFITGVNTIIVDECHQIKATILKQLLTQNFANIPIRWGITGTIPKEDFNQQSLITSIGPIVNEVKASDLQEKGILSTCHINICQFYDTVAFKLYHDEHKYLVSEYTRVKFMSNMISNISSTGNTLVLVSLIDTGELLKEMIPDSVFIHGVVKSKDRKEEYDAFESENSKVLIATYGVAAVGINIISLYNLVLIEPGKSFVKVIQSIGRGLRKGFDKDHVEVWDFSSTCKFSKKHLTERKRYYKDANYKYTVQKLDWR